MSYLMHADPEVAEAIRQETRDRPGNLEMIASEKLRQRGRPGGPGKCHDEQVRRGSSAVADTTGAANWSDIVERLAIERSKQLFGAEHANVQPHAGSSGQHGRLFCRPQAGDTILGYEPLPRGTSLPREHGHFFGKFYHGVSTGWTGKTNHRLQRSGALAKQHRPKIIVVGASAYPRTIDYEKFRVIADQVRGPHPRRHRPHRRPRRRRSPPVSGPLLRVRHDDHPQDLAGPRGGLILCKKEFAQALDVEALPGMQGGRSMHIIAAKAVALKEALTDDFKRYQARS